jgi:hypothetical protein
LAASADALRTTAAAGGGAARVGELKRRAFECEWSRDALATKDRTTRDPVTCGEVDDEADRRRGEVEVSRGRTSPTGRTARGIVTKTPPESARPPAQSSAGSGWDTLPVDESDWTVDPAELREFLAGDLFDVQADPVFKERLRQKLWRLVRVRYGGATDED